MKGEVVERFMELISYHHPLFMQFHHAAGKVGMFVPVHKGWQYHKVNAVMQRIAAVMVMAAEASLDCRGRGNQLGNLPVIPEQAMLWIGRFGKQREVAGNKNSLPKTISALKLLLKPCFLRCSNTTLG